MVLQLNLVEASTVIPLFVFKNVDVYSRVFGCDDRPATQSRIPEDINSPLFALENSNLGNVNKF